jgi:hypothetical protein
VTVARWYPSKVDPWLAVVLAVAPVVSLVGVVATLIAGDGLAIAIAGFAVLVGVYLGLVFPMRYGIEREHLVVRHGLVRQRVRLADITLVRPTRNPLSSPALSLDRLAIRFGTGLFKSVMISPAAKDEFLAELAARAGLRRDGDGLVRG